MRLLPHTWQGLHPAFPVDSNPPDSCLCLPPPIMADSPLLPSGRGCGLMAVLCVAAGAVAKRPSIHRGIGFLVKTTVFATGVSVAHGINREIQERRMAADFLRIRRIEVPDFRVVDRLSHWDADNSSIVGGIAGLLAARRQCPLPTITRPVWFAIHVISGLWFAGLFHSLQRNFAKSDSAGIEHAAKAQRLLQQLSYQPEVQREILLEMLPTAQVMRAVFRGELTISPEIFSALKRRQQFRMVGNRHHPLAHDKNMSVIGLITMQPNESDDFHKTFTRYGESHPTPYPVRNYDWSGNPQDARATPTLETHIAKLRQKRQQACDEGQVMRDWQYGHEQAYYKLKEASNGHGSDELKARKRHLECLNRWSVHVWRMVSECDWMIADAQHQLAVAKAAEQGREWLPTADSEQPVELKHTLRSLGLSLKALDDYARPLDHTIKQMRQAGGQISTLPSTENHLHNLEQLQGIVDEERKTMQRVWKETMAKSKPRDEASSPR